MICEKPTVGAQALPSGAPRDGLKRLAVAFPALILAQINPGLAVADLRPIG